MKKLLIALLAMGVFSVAEAKVYKITKFTKAQTKEAQEYATEGSGDLFPFATDKGLLWVHIQSSAMDTLHKAKIGECYDVKGEDPFYDKAKKVKCPTNTAKKPTKKKMTQTQIDACVNKYVEAFRKETGDNEAPIRFDVLEEWQNWCEAGKQL